MEKYDDESQHKTGGPGNEAVQAATGKDWQSWFEILDQAGAQGMDHKGIVAYLKDHYDVSPWWQQQVTVSYEQARGLRKVHQRPDGYQISRSKTLLVAVSNLFAAWEDTDQRDAWLGKENIEIRTYRKDKSMRISWSQPTGLVEVNFYAKGAGKSQVTVQHSKLDRADQAEDMKVYWSRALDNLKTYLESNNS